MPTIRVNGVDLAYDQAGAGPTIVFWHAGIADRRMWEHQFRQLAADHRVIRFDWRGYGQSGDAAGRLAHHEDLLGLLDVLEIQQTALVGCSMGGLAFGRHPSGGPGRRSRGDGRLATRIRTPPVAIWYADSGLA